MVIYNMWFEDESEMQRRRRRARGLGVDHPVHSGLVTLGQSWCSLDLGELQISGPRLNSEFFVGQATSKFKSSETNKFRNFKFNFKFINPFRQARLERDPSEEEAYGTGRWRESSAKKR